MKKKKVRKAPSYLKRPQNGENRNLAFFNSPYYKYVIAGTAVLLIVLSLLGASYLLTKQAPTVLGVHVTK